VQQSHVVYVIYLHEDPIGKRSTAFAVYLVGKQLNRAIEDSVVVRFQNPFFAVVVNRIIRLCSMAAQICGLGCSGNIYYYLCAVSPTGVGSIQHTAFGLSRRNRVARIRRTEVRPIFSRRAIADLLTSARCSFRISAACMAAVAGRPSRFPFSRACANPARVRSRRISRSNSAKIASRPAIARPAGVVRSRASVSDTKPTPRCSSS